MADVFETTGQDWANHLSHEMSGNGTICLVALLSGMPDADILRQATADVIAAQPVLGCRFDDTAEPPLWVPAGDENRFEQAEAGSLCEGLDTFFQEAVAAGRMMEVRLISCPGEFALCLLMDHSAADGGGAKACLHLMSQFYNIRLAGKDPSKRIPPDRSERQIFERLSIRDYRLALKKGSPAPGGFITVPYHGTDGHAAQYTWVSLPLPLLRRPGCTVNDLLLTATARALAHGQGQTGTASIQFTVDLRRYFSAEDAPAACNMSGIESVSLPVSPDEPFSQTLSGICAQTQAIKGNLPGLSSAAAMMYLRSMPYDAAKAFLMDAEKKRRLSGASEPILSNLGLFTPGTMRFGSIPVTDVLPLLPAFHAPAFMLGAAGYHNMVNLSAGFYPGDRDEEDVRRFLYKMRNELLNLAGE